MLIKLLPFMFLLLCRAYTYVALGNPLVESTFFDQKVVGSTRMDLGQVACRASACKLRHHANCCGRGVLLKDSCCEKRSLYKWINTNNATL